MTGRPLVSIVIDNYNYARFLRRSIDSALGQTGVRTEVIVVDDRSTDGSRDVIAGYGDRVRAVLKTVNEGHGAAFNAGFAASTGEVVLFLDSDDYLYPHAAATVAEALRGGAVQAQFRLDLVDADGRRLDLYPPAETRFDGGDVVPLLLGRGRYSTTVTSGLGFSRAALRAVMPMPPEEFRQGGDGYLVATVPFHGAVVSIEEVLGAYCKHGTNHSGFLMQVARRARWRLEHDAARRRAIAREAAAAGLAPADADGANDMHHLEERLASWTLEPRLHPAGRERRAALGWRAARAALAQPTTGWRRATVAATFLAIGLLPRAAAGRIIVWKTEAAARPAAVTALAGMLRRRRAPPMPDDGG